MKKYALLLVALLSTNVMAHGSAAAWFIGGAFVGAAAEHSYRQPRVEYHYYQPHVPPQPVVIYSTPVAPTPSAPVYVAPEGYEFCPPGYYIIRKVNQYGYAENVGCGR